jgi:hypothetical protein
MFSFGKSSLHLVKSRSHFVNRVSFTFGPLITFPFELIKFVFGLITFPVGLNQVHVLVNNVHVHNICLITVAFA